MSILPTSKYVHCVCVPGKPTTGQKSRWDSLEPEFQMAVGCPVVLGTKPRSSEDQPVHLSLSIISAPLPCSYFPFVKHSTADLTKNFLFGQDHYYE